MNSNKSTYLFFDTDKVIISQDIVPVFKFLIEIEKEMEVVMGFGRRLEDIKNQYKELLDFVLFLSNKLKENGIDFNYKLKECPESFVDKLYLNVPIRSQMIVNFAVLEVLFALHIAYEKETYDLNEIKKVATRDNKFLNGFLRSYLLTEENSYFKKNKQRFINITAIGIRTFRNFLTHFFSIAKGEIMVSFDTLCAESQELEQIVKRKRKNIVFISPIDLYELVKAANVLKLMRWSNDYSDNQLEFKRKIQFVINVVSNHGAVIIKKNNI